MDVAVTKIEPATQSTIALARPVASAEVAQPTDSTLSKQIESSAQSGYQAPAPRSEQEANELIDKVADSIKVDRYLNFLSAFLDEPERYRAFVEHLNELKIDGASKASPSLSGVSLKV